MTIPLNITNREKAEKERGEGEREREGEKRKKKNISVGELLTVPSEKVKYFWCCYPAKNCYHISEIVTLTKTCK